MKIILTTLKKVLFWSYDRGTWQYDIMCVLILAFIFFGPNKLFHSHRSVAADETAESPIFVKAGELQPSGGTLEERVARQLAEKYGHNVTVARVDEVRDDAGRLTGYLAWEE